MKILYLYNETVDRFEAFLPQNINDVKLYVEGPVVYETLDLECARTYVFADCLRRILTHCLRYGVRCVTDVMDTDDRCAFLGNASNCRGYELKFFETMDELAVSRPDFVARVTDHMDVVSDFAWNGLNGFAHKNAFSSSLLYFDSKKFLEKMGPVFPEDPTAEKTLPRRKKASEPAPSATAASPVTLASALVPSRPVEKPTEEERDRSKDFVVWKSQLWTDVRGRCNYSVPSRETAVAAVLTYHFGDAVDLLVGRADSRVPRHERAISMGRVHHFGRGRDCCFTRFRQRWIQYCVHAGGVCRDPSDGVVRQAASSSEKGQKHARTVGDLLTEGRFSPGVLRFALMRRHYRENASLRDEDLEEARERHEALAKHVETVRRRLSSTEAAVERRNGAAVVYRPRAKTDVCGIDRRMEIGEEMNVLNEFKKEMDSKILQGLDIPGALVCMEHFVRTLAVSGTRDMSIASLEYCFRYAENVMDKWFGLRFSREPGGNPAEKKEEKKEAGVAEFVEGTSERLEELLKIFRSEARHTSRKKVLEAHRRTLLKMCEDMKDKITTVEVHDDENEQEQNAKRVQLNGD